MHKVSLAPTGLTGPVCARAYCHLLTVHQYWSKQLAQHTGVPTSCKPTSTWETVREGDVLPSTDWHWMQTLYLTRSPIFHSLYHHPLVAKSSTPLICTDKHTLATRRHTGMSCSVCSSGTDTCLAHFIATWCSARRVASMLALASYQQSASCGVFGGMSIWRRKRANVFAGWIAQFLVRNINSVSLPTDDETGEHL